MQESMVYVCSIHRPWCFATVGKGRATTVLLAFVFTSLIFLAANLKPKLIIHGQPGPKLPHTNDTILLALGPVLFVVELDDPHHLLQNLSTDWEFHLDGHKSQTFHTPKSIIYNFTKEGNYDLWVTSRMRTRHHQYSTAPLNKNLLIKGMVFSSRCFLFLIFGCTAGDHMPWTKISWVLSKFEAIAQVTSARIISLNIENTSDICPCTYCTCL